MDDAFILHLIRHAPTRGNKLKQYIGWTDEPVLEFEAKVFPDVAEVWGSDLLRCRQTAKRLFPNACYQANADFRECHFGEWEQKTYAQLEQDNAYRKWIDDPYSYSPPAGESLAEMAARVERAVLALPAGYEFTVVAHGGPIRYLMARGKQTMFQQQLALHGTRHTLVWQNRQAFKEGVACISCSAEPLMANATL
ncbi:histidine phosphatase family protein [Planococcus sp. YIM B11945]|uniref:histidine phosphatase family protein n=1 Tax=Planococcus sp. YIM B11945 TaxID=3435410 RepID=UPI003D7D616D